MTIQDYKKKFQQLRGSISDEVERIIYANEEEICLMNIQNIDDHVGSDGQALRNTNKKYSGVYQPMTVNISKMEGSLLPKVLGQPYNWMWTGQFIGGFKVKVLKNSTQIQIYSTGQGSGLKKSFFDGYKNLYGLTLEDQRILNQEIIKPQLEKYIQQYLR